MLEDALHELSELEPAEQQQPPAMALRAAVFSEGKRWAELADLSRTMIDRDRSDPAWWIHYAYAVRRVDCMEAAEKILMEAVSDHPGNATIQFNLGCYACRKGNIDEALRRVRIAIKCNPAFRDVARTDPDLEEIRDQLLRDAGR